MENAPKRNKNLVLAGIAMVVIVAPVIGVWNTFNAAQNRKKTLAEMPKVQKLDGFSLVTAQKTTVTTDSLVDRLTLLVNLDTKKTVESDKIISTLVRMDEQFGKLEQTQFYIISDSVALSKSQINAKIRDINNFIFLPNQPLGVAAFPPNMQMAVVDTSATVRNFYNINDDQSVRAMVRHFPFLIPLKKAAKPKLDVKPEK